MHQNRVDDDPEVSTTLLEDLLRKSREFVEGVIADRIRDSMERALDWTFRRMITYLTVAVLFGSAVVFALLAGLEGMKQAGVPSWASYLTLGLAGALGGSLLLLRPKPSGSRR